MSLVCIDEHGLLRDIEKLIKRDIPKVTVEGYEPSASVKAKPATTGRKNRGNASKSNTAGRNKPRNKSAARSAPKNGASGSSRSAASKRVASRRQRHI
jgi:ATP-dependent RNA helicase RhlE